MTALNTFSDVLRHAVKNGYKTEYTELMLQAAELLDAKVYTRPAAPIEGLETIGFANPEEIKALGERGLDYITVTGEYFANSSEMVVTRSQAEAIIAAEREAQQRLLDIIEEANTDKEALQADNAALTTRVKELEHDLNGAKGNAKNAMSNLIYWRDQTEALETQLATARKALEKLTLHSNSLALAHVHKTQKNAGIWGALKEARAALEAKP